MTLALSSTMTTIRAKRYTITDWYVASQMLVWECQQMMRDENFVRKANGNSYETGHRTGVYTSKIPAEHYSK